MWTKVFFFFFLHCKIGMKCERVFVCRFFYFFRFFFFVKLLCFGTQIWDVFPFFPVENLSID